MKTPHPQPAAQPQPKAQARASATAPAPHPASDAASDPRPERPAADAHHPLLADQPPALLHWPRPYWAQVSTRDFARAQQSGLAQRTTAILPVGATEQHGPHLPLDVDTALACGVLEAALSRLDTRRTPVLVLPAQPVGLSIEHQDYPGTLTLSAPTLLALWTEIGQCVARAGLRRLLIFNAHGGNVSAMDIAARQLRMQCGLMVWHASWFNLPQPEGADAAFGPVEQRFGIHAGAVETSMMLHLAPHTVCMAQARDFASASQQRARDFPILGNGRSARLGWAMQDYQRSGACGNATLATAAHGQALVEGAAQSLAAMLEEIHRLPDSTLAAAPGPVPTAAPTADAQHCACTPTPPGP